MELWLLTISLFVKAYIPISAKSIDYLSRIPLYFAVLVIVLSLILGKGTGLEFKKSFNKKVCISIAALLITQLILMFISSRVIGDSPLNRNPLKQFLILCTFIVCIFIYYYAVKILIHSKQNVYRFIQGNLIALFVILFISYIQFFYLLFPAQFAGAAGFIGHFFENRADRYWYYNGSYVQTIHRVNGLVSEAGFFAAKMLIVFVPFILASIKNRINLFSQKIKYNQYMYFILLISIIVILFASKSTTGMLAVAIIFISLWLNLSNRFKLISLLSIGMIGVIFVLFYPKNGPIYYLLNETLLHKSATESSINRSGGTITLIYTWLKHFFFGVGYNFHTYYLFESVPEWARHNNEYVNTFVPRHYYPILSVFLGWLVQFGAIFVGTLIVYVYKLLRDLRLICKKAKYLAISDEKVKWINALKDSAHYYIVFYLIIALFSFDWSDSIYLLMFFFFVVLRQLLIKYVKLENFRSGNGVMNNEGA